VTASRPRNQVACGGIANTASSGSSAASALMSSRSQAGLLPTVGIARRLKVTPSAVSQNLKLLHATGLVSRARDGRYVLYRRSELGDRVVGQPGT